MSYEDFQRRSPYREIKEALDRRIAYHVARLQEVRAWAQTPPRRRQVTEATRPSVGPASPLAPNLPQVPPLSGVPSRSWMEDRLTDHAMAEIRNRPDRGSTEYGTIIYQDADGAVRMTPIATGDDTHFDPNRLPPGSKVLRMIHNHPIAGALAVNGKDRQDDEGRPMPPLVGDELKKAVINSGIFPSPEDFQYLYDNKAFEAKGADQVIIGYDNQPRRYTQEDRAEIDKRNREYWAAERVKEQQRKSRRGF
jgi:hypothetical protein